MRSQKQIEASRINGAKSRGPVTTIGRLNSAHPNWRQSLLSRSIVAKDESRDRFNEIHRALVQELQPTTAIENLLVQKMMVAQWRQMRLWGLEKRSVDLQRAFDSQVGMSESRYDRQFNRSLATLLSLRENKKAPEPAKCPSTLGAYPTDEPATPCADPQISPPNPAASELDGK
jgi:hypothetical protein